MTERLRCLVLEEQEHWETFLEKREHLAEAADAVRSGAKLEALGEALSPELLLEQRLDLCRALYRLHFQVPPASLSGDIGDAVGYMLPRSPKH